MTTTLDKARTTPRTRECLTCYLYRMLAQFGCHRDLRWTLHWRDHNAPRKSALARSLMDRGGFCDCEVIFTVFRWHTARDVEDPLMSCRGVRRGTVNPCRRRYPRKRTSHKE
jgi:hypothetical protein